jgi:multidrug transporter EmrE-like cation transporter
MNAFVWIFVGVALNTSAQLLLKIATQRLGAFGVQQFLSMQGLWALFGQWPMALGLVCYGLSLLVWLIALSRVEVSLAYPMLALGYVFNALAAQHFLHEMIGPQRWCAIGLILLGVLVLAKS